MLWSSRSSGCHLNHHYHIPFLLQSLCNIETVWIANTVSRRRAAKVKHEGLSWNSPHFKIFRCEDHIMDDQDCLRRSNFLLVFYPQVNLGGSYLTKVFYQFDQESSLFFPHGWWLMEMIGSVGRWLLCHPPFCIELPVLSWSFDSRRPISFRRMIFLAFVFQTIKFYSGNVVLIEIQTATRLKEASKAIVQTCAFGSFETTKPKAMCCRNSLMNGQNPSKRQMTQLTIPAIQLRPPTSLSQSLGTCRRTSPWNFPRATMLRSPDKRATMTALMGSWSVLVTTGQDGVTTGRPPWVVRLLKRSVLQPRHTHRRASCTSQMVRHLRPVALAHEKLVLPDFVS